MLAPKPQAHITGRAIMKDEGSVLALGFVIVNKKSGEPVKINNAVNCIDINDEAWEAAYKNCLLEKGTVVFYRLEDAEKYAKEEMGERVDFAEVIVR
jgi:hypothetical protein